MTNRPWLIAGLVLVFAALITLYDVNRMHLRSDRGPATDASLSAPTPPMAAGADACEDIYQTVCAKPGETHDLTGTVDTDVAGEKQALRVYQDIIRDHPQWDSSQVDDELVNTIYSPKRRARIEAIFNWVQGSITRLIARQPETVFNRREKDQIIKRIKKTVLQLPPPASVYADEPDLFTKSDAYYERLPDGTLRLRIGGAYFFIAKSRFNIIFTLGHELAHAIDPCEIRTARLAFPAYDRLKACFMVRGLVNVGQRRNECVEKDQLSEAFADWIAVQVTAEALRTFSTEFQGQALLHAAINAVRDLCEQDEESEAELDTEFHPPPRVRIQRIFGDNPEIRTLLGCSPRVDQMQYCNFE